jgi:hypothetical protein
LSKFELNRICNPIVERVNRGLDKINYEPIPIYYHVWFYINYYNHNVLFSFLDLSSVFAGNQNAFKLAISFVLSRLLRSTMPDENVGGKMCLIIFYLIMKNLSILIGWEQFNFFEIRSAKKWNTLQISLTIRYSHL